MAIRVSDEREHRSKWVECYRAAALLARSKEATYTRADGSPSVDAAAWSEIADCFERKVKGGRGFLSMSPLLTAELASVAGTKSHKVGGAHVFTSDEAREAGARGGAKVSGDRKHMAQIGRRGGLARSDRLASRKKRDASMDDDAG